jgi:iron complex transport system permease protein
VRKKNLLLILILVLFLLGVAALFLGSVWVPPQEFLNSPIILQIRLPRIIAAILVGTLLATAGVILQGVLRNPLADPYILGVSSGAGVGAALALGLKFTQSFLGISSIPFSAFIFALLAVFTVYNLARVAGRTSPETLILAGVAVSAFAAAILSLIIILTGQLQSIYFWLLGGLSSITWLEVINLVPYTIVGLLIAYFYSKELNALLFGEEMAMSLGVEVERVRQVLILAAALMTAAAVSVSGLIGFVGLIIPHFVRLILGANHRLLVPFSALGGALLVLGADIFARTVLSPQEIPIGIVMSLLGAPFFLYLLRRRRSGEK